MSEPMSDRRLAENEVFFKRANTRLAKDFTELKHLAKADGQEEWLPHANQPIQFFCECADEKCRKRIELSSEEYTKLHKNEAQFVICPGHNVPTIERIVRSEKNYVIVEKYFTPPSKPDHLNPTDLSTD